MLPPRPPLLTWHWLLESANLDVAVGGKRVESQSRGDPQIPLSIGSCWVRGWGQERSQFTG